MDSNSDKNFILEFLNNEDKFETNYNQLKNSDKVRWKQFIKCEISNGDVFLCSVCYNVVYSYYGKQDLGGSQQCAKCDLWICKGCLKGKDVAEEYNLSDIEFESFDCPICGKYLVVDGEIKEF
jgi:hypothetical protein